MRRWTSRATGQLRWARRDLSAATGSRTTDCGWQDPRLRVEPRRAAWTVLAARMGRTGWPGRRPGPSGWARSHQRAGTASWGATSETGGAGTERRPPLAPGDVPRRYRRARSRQGYGELPGDRRQSRDQCRLRCNAALEVDSRVLDGNPARRRVSCVADGQAASESTERLPNRVGRGVGATQLLRLVGTERLQVAGPNLTGLYWKAGYDSLRQNSPDQAVKKPAWDAWDSCNRNDVGRGKSLHSPCSYAASTTKRLETSHASPASHAPSPGPGDPALRQNRWWEDLVERLLHAGLLIEEMGPATAVGILRGVPPRAPKAAPLNSSSSERPAALGPAIAGGHREPLAGGSTGGYRPSSCRRAAPPRAPCVPLP